MIQNRTEVIQKLKRRAKSSSIFANLETIGSYDDFSQVVCLDYLDEQGFLQLINSFDNARKEKNADLQKQLFQKNYELYTKFYSTCIHELTHWLDHTSTLWGQRQLILIYNSINAWTNQREQEFYRIAIANSQRHRARLAIYYTEKYSVNHENYGKNPWQYEYGSGIEFGMDGKPRQDRPFIYTVFKNTDNERIIRVPFSMFALTESNATYAELEVKLQMLSGLEESQRIVEQSNLGKMVINNLYNSKLAIYSVATHCLANSIKIDEPFLAYKFSSILSTFCLNLPSELYQSLKVPTNFNIWGDRVQALKNIADPGFAFFTIAQNAPKYNPSVSVEQWLEKALSNSGLPNLETVKKSTLIAVDELKDEIIDGIYTNRLNLLLSAGKENLIKRKIWGKNSLSIENMYQNLFTLPPIVLGDWYTTPIAPKVLPINQETMEKWIDQITDIELAIEEFIRACRF